MITLNVLIVLYTIIGLWRFKKLYGHYNLFYEEPQLWIFLLCGCVFVSITNIIFACIKYLP
jgi:hypothetical protein